jgi:AcrR family transcriptional regulator
MDPTPPTTRAYGGRSADDRRRERRERLLAAGLEEFGTVGIRGTSIRRVIKRAGLAERYFYESFAGLDELLAAVYDAIMERVLAATVAAVEDAGDDPAEQIRAGLRAYFEASAEDPWAQRIQLFEIVAAGPDSFERGRSVIVAFGAFITQRMSAVVTGAPVDLNALATALSGAFYMVHLEWTLGHLELDLDAAVDHCAWILDSVVERLLTGEAGPAAP